MTPDQVQLVQQSFAKVAPISEQAAVLFYDRLFEVAPSVKSLFPADMTEQRKKLMATLAVVVGGLEQSRLHFAGGERAGQTPCRLWREARALSGGRRRVAVDAGKRLGRATGRRKSPQAWTAAYGTLSGFMIAEAYGRPQAGDNRRRTSWGLSRE